MQRSESRNQFISDSSLSSSSSPTKRDIGCGPCDDKILCKKVQHSARPTRQRTPTQRSSLATQNSDVYWETTGDVLRESNGEFDIPPFPSLTAKSIQLLELKISSTSSTTIVSSHPPTESTITLGKRKPSSVLDVFGEDHRAPSSAIIRNVKKRLLNDSDVFTGEDMNNSADSVPNIDDTPLVLAPHFLQNYMKSFQLSLGVQWEIARLISINRIQGDDISIAMLNELKGTNVVSAPRVAHILLPDSAIDQPTQFVKAFEQELKHKSPWLELDKEEEAFKQSSLSVLGCSDNDPWYGGKVQFIGKLKRRTDRKSNEDPYYITLERPELGPSTRFTRRFGSADFLRIKIMNELRYREGEDIINFLSRPIVLSGNVYRAFFSKETTVFFKRTNEEYHPQSRQITVCSDSLRSSLSEFLNWHNPLHLNINQSVAKWAARFALGLSNSVPGMRLNQSNIFYIEEKISDEYRRIPGEKPPSEVEMTDGCGFANATLLQNLREVFSWEVFPTAIQCRVGGAKGLLLLHPNGRYDDEHKDPQVYIRPSQSKIKYSSDITLDPAMLTVDVLRSAKMKVPSRLSRETIVNLAENGVPHETFKLLLERAVSEVVNGLTTWEGRFAMENLWLNVARIGGVINSRMARELGGESRARGFGHKEDEAENEDDEDDLQVDPAFFQHSTAWWADQVSGCPSSLEETVMVLIDSGFHPRSCPVLAEKLKKVVEKAVNTFISKWRIEVPMSCDAFVVPDPFGVLEPGQIHVKTSRPMMGQDGLDTDLILGDVLVTRHPCKVPSDVQKVKAVYHEKLRHYTDVIVFPVKGKRSLASMLGGGDYDGDKVTVIWQPDIVSRFKNSSDRFASPPPDFDAAFEKSKETVKDLIRRAPPDRDHALHVRELQKYLLGSLRNQAAVGLYSKWHDNAVYNLGYFHEESIRLAYMFCACLDGSKTGLIVKKDVFDMDRRQYGRRPPAWKESREEALRNECANVLNMPRGKDLAQFIMDELKRKGMDLARMHMAKYDFLLKGGTGNESSFTLDEHLVNPWLYAQRRAQQFSEATGCDRMKADLVRIADHVKNVRTQHRENVNLKHTSPNAKSLKKPGNGKDTGASFTSLDIVTRQDVLRDLSQKFAMYPLGIVSFDEEEIRRLMASYAYFHDSEEQKHRPFKWTRFPWDVAMRSLCEIKAKALGPSKTITSSFYEKLTVCSAARS